MNELRLTGTRRIATVLRLIASHQREGIGLTELARMMELEMPTAHRVLKELERERFIERGQSKRYRLGALLMELGVAAVSRSTLIESVRPHLVALAEVTGDTVFLIARSGDDSVCLDRAEGSFPIKTLILEKGGRRPLGVGGASMHLLSSLATDEANQIIRRNAWRYKEFYNVDAERLTREYREAKAMGYGIARDSQAYGVTAIGIALPESKQHSLHIGVGVTCISSRMTEQHQEVVLGEIRRCVKGIEGALDAELET